MTWKTSCTSALKNLRLWLLSFLVLSSCAPGSAGSRKTSECGAGVVASPVPIERQPAEVLRVVDGDTLDARITLGYDVFIKLRIRLHGVDTPEKYGVKKGTPEYEAGQRASLFTSTWVEKNQGKIEVCGNHGTDKYGRWLLELCAGDENLGKVLVSSGNATEYRGGS